MEVTVANQYITFPTVMAHISLVFAIPRKLFRSMKIYGHIEAAASPSDIVRFRRNTLNEFILSFFVMKMYTIAPLLNSPAVAINVYKAFSTNSTEFGNNSSSLLVVIVAPVAFMCPIVEWTNESWSCWNCLFRRNLVY